MIGSMVLGSAQGVTYHQSMLKGESSREKDADPEACSSRGSPQEGGTDVEDACNIVAAKLDEHDPETDDELIELCWQDLISGSSSHKAKDNSNDELVEDDATFDQDPQLPGSPSRTEAIAARLMQEAKGRSADAHKRS